MKQLSAGHREERLTAYAPIGAESLRVGNGLKVTPCKIKGYFVLPCCLKLAQGFELVVASPRLLRYGFRALRLHVTTHVMHRASYLLKPLFRFYFKRVYYHMKSYRGGYPRLFL